LPEKIKDRTGSAVARKKAFEREIASAKTDSYRVPTSIDAYKASNPGWCLCPSNPSVIDLLTPWVEGVWADRWAEGWI
jgi:hypothetical protein